MSTDNSRIYTVIPESDTGEADSHAVEEEDRGDSTVLRAGFDNGSSSQIPWKRLLPFFILRSMDALTYGLIFPFIIEYMTSLEIPQDKIGLYAGIAEGSLMFAEASIAPIWAILADKLGRKKCSTWGFMISVISCGMVGFGKSAKWIIFWRMCIGLNPTPVLSKILITEFTHPTNREFIFSIYSPIFNTGYLIGHLIGGWLADPYGRLPFWLGGNSDFFQKWPYALPCLVNSFLGLLAVVVGLLFLEEVSDVGFQIAQLSRTDQLRGFEPGK
uniref:Major facilitator superfamily (MFS) profile domain-containing protein n=1 Tax=Kwoniella pini CBS 10737 TaxID=1296096 RepID=A0A1B9I0Q8_9TREE|nr:uncharacterized protein I206_04718 [Kwoniella pini CBS 10737]OCF49031.1 hypothetical protein I206_04718 [Kwoniella pini CBS 10737]